MINPKEIRIGNYVRFGVEDKRNLGKVLAINEKQVLIKTELDRRAWLNIEYIEPVPLTQEVLEKCGFEREKNECYDDLSDHFKEIHDTPEYFFDFFEYLDIDVLVDGSLSIRPNDSLIFLEKTPTTLHQLQNLYFAITGEELEIKL